MVKEEGGCSAQWSREQEKAFENALAAHSEDCSEHWEKIAAAVPGKTIEDVRHHYELLVEDVNGIESGLVPLPYYPSSPEGSGHGKKEVHSHGDPSAKTSRSDQERRKGIAWTEDEHRLFLLGLDKYGKGDWRSISRNFVISRTPTQVASHAQKYFIRLKSMNKERRRTSIHDITSVGGDGDASAPQGPITGLTSGTAAMTTNAGKPLEQSPPPRPSAGGAPTGTRIMYGTAPVSHHPAPHMVHGKRSLNDSLGAAII